ncbi:hypothetical protein ACX3O0_01505 [Homoserinimonas sp. A447]
MRPDDWAPIGHDHDPVPGNASVVSSAATDYANVATAIEEAASNLRALACLDESVSEAVAAIMEQADEVAGRIERAHERYFGVAEALSAYAVPFAEAQRWSVDALDAAIAANSAVATAQDTADLYQAKLREDDLSPTLEAYYQQKFETASASVRTNGGSLEQAVALLQSAITHRDTAATTAIGAISDVENSGDLNDSWWDNTVQFINEHKDIIDRIVEIVGWIATAAMVIALFIPGLNAIVGVILLVATIIQVANAIVQGLAGTMSPSEAIFTVALAALTFVGGKVATTMATNATRTTVATSVRTSYAGSGIAGMTQQRALGLVDTAGVFGDVRNLSLMRQLQNIGTDYRVIAQLDSMANVQLLSGSHATGAATALNRLSAYNASSTAGGIAIELGQVGDRVGSLTGDSTWRLGSNW